ncbi:kinase-like domain-containing protein [Rhizophagus diaphanus]|nr:kinase-like domain-containing protein [Rhizophagus diaphanus] [Rhizophagus sp. MUCL 43196]
MNGKDPTPKLKSRCNKHKIIGITNIEECCRNCLKILYFKQIPASYFCYNASDYGSYNVIEREKYCKLCEKSLYQGTNHNIAKEFKLCSNCYLISSGWIESTLTKNLIPIIYLPWWNNISYCETCYSKLIFTSKCQKHCMNCLIFYIGCRYCLTTNLIFGFTNQSQCKKCERISFITFDVTNISSGNSCLDDFLFNSRHSNLKLEEFPKKIKNIDKYFLPISVYVKEIARGGFCIIYQATWLNDPIYDDGNIYSMKRNKENRRNESVILKRFKSSENLSKYFLNEGFTKITWNNKLQTLWQISEGIYSGNILLTSSYYLHRWQIGDLGLSQSANNTSSNNDMGMIMWEFTTGCKPFSNFEHDIRLIYKILDGLRPNITEDTPENYANLMKSCWDSDPQKRPSIAEICLIFRDWYLGGNGKLGPEFVERTHSKAIYTSRSLNVYISKIISIDFSSLVSFENSDNKQELEFDIEL